MSSQNPGVVLNEEAQEIIRNLINIETKASNEKQAIFHRLAELWTQELSVGVNSGNMFENNRAFINSVIRSTYDTEADRNSDQIYKLLKDNQSYQTESGVIIPSNPYEIAKYKTHHNSILRRIERQFNRLAVEFDDFIANKGVYIQKSSKSIELICLVIPEPRTVYDPRGPTISYGGLAPFTEPPEKKTKRGKNQRK